MNKPNDELNLTNKNTFIFLFKHTLAGALGGALFGFLFLYFNVSNLWSMISSSPDGTLYTFMMFFGLITTFGSMGMGFGVFSLAQETDQHTSDHPYY